MHGQTYHSTNGLVSYLPANTLGRDFAVGDVHGHFLLLEQLIEQANFDPSKDRLFAVGDLVDRGPESLCVVSWLKQPWFHSVRGNHEQWCIHGGLTAPSADHLRFGGSWFHALTPSVRRAIAMLMQAKMPIAIDIAAADGARYGIVHAECPATDWERMLIALADDDHDRHLHYFFAAMEGRERFYNPDVAPAVASVDRLYVGHTFTSEVDHRANVTYLDTGGCFPEGRLTMVQIGNDDVFFEIEHEAQSLYQ